jgi:hypothetical protein
VTWKRESDQSSTAFGAELHRAGDTE